MTEVKETNITLYIPSREVAMAERKMRDYIVNYLESKEKYDNEGEHIGYILDTNGNFFKVKITSTILQGTKDDLLKRLDSFEKLIQQQIKKLEGYAPDEKLASAAVAKTAVIDMINEGKVPQRLKSKLNDDVLTVVKEFRKSIMNDYLKSSMKNAVVITTSTATVSIPPLE